MILSPIGLGEVTAELRLAGDGVAPSQSSGKHLPRALPVAFPGCDFDCQLASRVPERDREWTEAASASCQTLLLPGHPAWVLGSPRARGHTLTAGLAISSAKPFTPPATLLELDGRWPQFAWLDGQRPDGSAILRPSKHRRRGTASSSVCLTFI